MKKLLTKTILVLTLVSSMLLVASPAVSTVSAASPKDEICAGINAASGGSGCEPKDTSGSSIDGILKFVLNILTVVVGLLSVIMIVVGGLKYVMSQGDSTQVNNAKNTILYALVGLAIVILAQVIVKFVINKVVHPNPKTTTYLLDRVV